MNYSDITDYTAKVCMLKGESGDTIKGIEKTSSSGLKDTYTITLSSGDKHTFTVENGNGIKSVAKTSTSGLVDTYTITFDDGNTSTFTVTNGEGVNTLKIGGRNLARSTNQGTTYWSKAFEVPDECTISEDTGSRGERCVKYAFSGYTSAFQAALFDDPHLRYAFAGLTGRSITVSFDAKADKAMKMYLSIRDTDFNHAMTDIYALKISDEGDWEHLSTTMSVTSDTAFSQFVYIGLDLTSKPTYLEIGNLKIEVGTVATDWSPAPEDILLNAYPVGSIYISVNNTSPATLFGGTWKSLGGRFLIGADSTYSAGSTGGEASHTLTTEEIPSHKHNLSSDARAHSFYWGMSDADVHASVNIASGAGTNNNLGSLQVDWAATAATGGGKAHNNLPPYLAVYMWERTA